MDVTEREGGYNDFRKDPCDSVGSQVVTRRVTQVSKKLKSLAVLVAVLLLIAPLPLIGMADELSSNALNSLDPSFAPEEVVVTDEKGHDIEIEASEDEVVPDPALDEQGPSVVEEQDPAPKTPTSDQDPYPEATSLEGEISEEEFTPAAGGNYEVYKNVTLIGSFTTLKDAVDACSDNSSTYFIKVLSDDTSMGAVAEVWGTGKKITILSDSATPYTITQTDNARHIHVYASNSGDPNTLTLMNVVLQGTGTPVSSGDNGGVRIGWRSNLVVGSGAVIQKCSAGEGGGIFVQDGTVTLSGGTITQNISRGNGGGIDGSSWAEITLSSGIISGNTAGDNGGGIHLQRSNSPANFIAMNGASQVVDNTATNNGGGIFIQDSSLMVGGTSQISRNNAGVDGGGVRGVRSTIALNDTSVVGDNKAEHGAGISINSSNDNSSSSSVTLDGGTVSDNVAGDRGGGINVDHRYTTFTMKQGTVSGNRAKTGGGIISSSNAPITIQGGTIEKNVSLNSGGGGILVETGSPLTVTGGTITLNEAQGGDGGGISAQGNNAVVLDNAVISNNKTSSNGGGIAVVSNTLVSENSRFLNNTAIDNGGGIYLYNNASTSVPASTVVDIRTADITGNTAGNDGGGVYLENCNKVSLAGVGILQNDAGVDGGGIRGTNSTLTMTDDNTVTNSIHLNTAEHGAGMSLNANSVVDITSTDVAQNTATDRGGGINIDSGTTFTMTSCLIVDNSARTGGGVISNRSDLTFVSGMVRMNTSSYGGGGFAVENGSMLTVNNGYIEYNNAGLNGGGIRVWDSVLTINGGAVSDNTASGNGGGVYLSTSSDLHMTNGAIANNHTPAGDGGGIFTEDLSYTDPVDPSCYTNLVISPTATISGNTSRSTEVYPSNYTVFTAFDGKLLTNDEINYRRSMYTLVYDSNGGQGGTETDAFLQNTTVTVKTSTAVGFAPLTPGYEFKYWSTDPGGEAAGGTRYDSGDSLMLDANTILYAIWGPPGAISGIVFQDNNTNNVYDAGEELAGKAVTLYKIVSGSRVHVGDTTTAVDGSYHFEIFDLDQDYEVFFELLDPAGIGQWGFIAKGAGLDNSNVNLDGYSDITTIGSAAEVDRTATINAGYKITPVISGAEAGPVQPWVILCFLAFIATTAILLNLRRRNKINV